MLRALISCMVSLAAAVTGILLLFGGIDALGRGRYGHALVLTGVAVAGGVAAWLLFRAAALYLHGRDPRTTTAAPPPRARPPHRARPW